MQEAASVKEAASVQEAGVSAEGDGGSSSSSATPNGTLYIVGLGLCDAQDITLRGLAYVKSCSCLFLEAYTSILSGSISSAELSAFYGKEVRTADRNLVESEADQIISPCLAGLNSGLLVVGDQHAQHLGRPTHHCGIPHLP